MDELGTVLGQEGGEVGAVVVERRVLGGAQRGVQGWSAEGLVVQAEGGVCVVFPGEMVGPEGFVGFLIGVEGAGVGRGVMVWDGE